MSGGSNNQSSTTNKPPGFVIPYSTDLLAQTQELTNQPYQPYGGQRLQGFTPFQQQGFNMVQNRAMGGSPTINAGTNMLTDTLSGAYLNGNPQLNAMIGQAQGDVADQYRYATGPGNLALASRTGSLDNSGVAGKDMTDRFSLARSLGDLETQFRYGNYAQERQNQMGALNAGLAYGNQPYLDAAQLGQAGGQQQQFGQAGLDVAYQEFLKAQEDPYQKIDTMRNVIQTAQTGFGQTKSGTSYPPWAVPASLLGGALGGGAFNNVGSKG